MVASEDEDELNKYSEIARSSYKSTGDASARTGRFKSEAIKIPDEPPEDYAHSDIESEVGDTEDSS